MIQFFKTSEINNFIKLNFIFIFQLGSINCFSQSIVPIRNTNNNSYEYIDTNSKKVISKFSYDQAAPFSEGLARVSRNGLYGFINLNGEEVIACKYINANNFSEGLASVSIGDLKVTTFMISAENEKYGAIDKSGNIVLPFEFGLIGSFKNKLARARDINSGKWGWINKEGSWKIMPQFSSADDFNEFQLAKVSILKSKEELNSPLSTEAFGYINEKGVFVISPIYGSLSDFQEGLTIAGVFRKDNVIQYGAINYKGEIVLPFIYDCIYNFKNGLAKVSKDEKWGVVDRTGNSKIPIKYRYISDFIEDCAWVNYDNYYGVINKENETKTPFIYDFIIEGIDTNKILVTKSGLWGMFDNRGMEIIPIMYELIERKDSSFIGINGNRHSYFNNQGKLQKEIIDDNWQDIYDKPIEDNWEQCTWSDEDKESLFNDAFYSGYEQDSIKDFFKIINKNGVLGIKNFDNKIIINPMYDSIKLANRSWFNYRNEDITLACYKGKKVDLCLLEQRNNNTECKILKTDYDLIANYYNEKTLLRVGKNGKFGMVKLINNQVFETVPLIFDAISSVYNDSLVLVKKNNLWGIWNIGFKNLELDFQLNKIKYSYYRSYAVSKNNKWALLNEDFVANTPFIYDNIKEFPCEENYYFLVNGKWGLITISGDEILRPIITKIIRSPNHGNADSGIYKIGRQSFLFFKGYPMYYAGAGQYQSNLTTKAN